ncbi:hypothetical protein ES703_116086 [subsurface metagenome]
MKIMQIITDYITQSLLTTQGDMVVRGAAIPKRLAAVAEGQVLKSAGVGAKPAWGVPRLGDMNFTSGVITRSTSGDTVVSGLGFQPAFVIFLAIDDNAADINFSIGIDYLSARIAIRLGINVADIHHYTDRSIEVYRTPLHNITGLISAIGGDGFTATFTLTGVCGAAIPWFTIG